MNFQALATPIEDLPGFEPAHGRIEEGLDEGFTNIQGRGFHILGILPWTGKRPFFFEGTTITIAVDRAQPKSGTI